MGFIRPKMEECNLRTRFMGEREKVFCTNDSNKVIELPLLKRIWRYFNAKFDIPKIEVLGFKIVMGMSGFA